MNRSGGKDSKISFDAHRVTSDGLDMPLYPYRLYCQRVDPTRNMACYHTLLIQPTLFGETAVVRCWGRIGSRGGEKSEIFETEREAAEQFLALAHRKRQKGYRPVGRCGNPRVSDENPALRQ